MTDPELDRRRMARAIALAERGGGGTSPNPMVGCVIAATDGRILGEGFHARAGEPHAEILALRAAEERGRPARGATAYVTLEPCAHHGRTPPCVDALVAAGVARVVFACSDPHAGKGGAARLAQAGVAVEAGVGAYEAEFLVEPWLHLERTGRPFFHLKSAVTLNGRITRGIDGARWITGPEARRAVHRLRRRHPAILIGIGTALADDPLLTVRDWPPADGVPGDETDAPWPAVQPIRVVLDATLRLPVDSRLVRSLAEAPVLVFCAPEADRDRQAALESRGLEIERVPASRGGVALEAVADALARRELSGVLVEPGPELARAVLDAGLADRWTIFLSPDVETAPDARPLWPDEARAPVRLREPRWERHGEDASVSGLVG